jgi:hypothetical protein
MGIQDTNLVTAFSTIQATPYVQTAIWFQWKDNPAGGLWYGVVDSSGNPKQSYANCQRFLRYEGIYANATTNTAIQNYFNSLGQTALGSPYDNSDGPWVHTNLYGYAQDLTGGSHARLTILASTNGTFELNDQHGLWSFYMTNNGATAYGPWLGNEFTYGSGTRQDFFQGYLTWDPISQVVWHQVNGTPLAITQNGILSWTGTSTLQSATNVAGPYLDVPGATSPYTNDSGALPQQFFRLRN